MRLLLFPFFFLYLMLCLSISTLRVVADGLGFMSSFLLSLGFLLLVIYFHFFRTRQILPFIDKPILAESNQEAAQQYIQYWETMRKLQPTHRDILLNLAALYEYAGDASKSAELNQQARQVDPNYFQAEK